MILITILVLITSSLIHFTNSGICDGPFNVSFTRFDSQTCNGSLLCYGSVSVANGNLEMTPDYRQTDPPPSWEIGRVLYRNPVPAWPASFCSVFTIRILKDPTAMGGDGMSFIIAQDDGPPPENSYGSFIGIFNESTEGVLHQVAIEFDTWKNEWDIDDNHVAIDIKSVKSPVAVRSLSDIGLDLKSGKNISFQVEYEGWSKNLKISAGYSGHPLVHFLSHTVQMKKTVPNSVFMGFTASTGPLVETHQLLSWNLSVVELPNKSLEDPEAKRKLYFTIFFTIGGFLLMGMICIPIGRRIRNRRKEKMKRRHDIETFIATAKGPKLIPYRKLSKSTRNFSEANLLGTGGFGSVYKGILSSNPPIAVAVKKISSTSRQGEKEYLAEICTIGRLRHKNLVQLQGWCHERGELLLVYEYMPNGSLDHYIGKRDSSLDWATRYDILQGLASALLYLHEECDNPVVHRDVKPNNVMLDAQYTTRLGDFGLAKLLHNETYVTTKIAGTPGYVAPEVSFTGRATLESDVYSFGMVVLEVVCGKRKKGLFDENGLVEEVWNFHEKGALLDCVDKRLENTYNHEQARRVLTLGLACLHPDYLFRPSMRKAVQIFVNPNEPIVGLPETRPDSICLTFNSSSASTNIAKPCPDNPKDGASLKSRANGNTKYTGKNSGCIHEYSPLNRRSQ